MRIAKAALAALATVVSVSTASAATIVYQLDDHPDGANTPPYEYGLRLDDLGTHHTFQNGGAFLYWDQDNDKAVIAGSINLSEAANPNANNLDGTTVGGSWNVYYEMTTEDVLIGGVDGFKSSNGVGSLWNGTERFDFTGKTDDDGVEAYFRNDGYRGASGWVFEGWVMANSRGTSCLSEFNHLGDYFDSGPSGTCVGDGSPMRANDFLITATPVVPLPAAGWMLLAGIGGLIGMRRRKQA
ncbi:MAG: VPLPA-CTERM sorting domain-containing protein [Pseudomonadota bacterium]